MLLVRVDAALGFRVIGEICSQQTAPVRLLPSLLCVEVSTILYHEYSVIGLELIKGTSRNLLLTDFSIGSHRMSFGVIVYFYSFLLRSQQAGPTECDRIRDWQAHDMALMLREAVSKVFSVVNRFRHS